MRVLVLGATGFIGTAVCEALAANNHEVVGLARSDESAQALETAGHGVLRGDVTEVNSIAKAAHDFDAVVNLAAPADQFVAELALAERLVEEFAGKEMTLVWTSGVRIVKPAPGVVGDESAELWLDGPVGGKAQAEKIVLDGGDGKFRTVAIRPPVVYGPEGTHLIGMLVGLSHGQEAVRVPGDGSARWSTVHVDDLARLYVLALEKGVCGRVYIGVSDDVVTVGELAAHVSTLSGREGRIEPQSVEELRPMIGPFADILSTDAVCSGERARSELGWEPSGEHILEVITSVDEFAPPPG